MSKQNATPRRAPGTGSLIIRTDKAGRSTYYGQWTAPGGKQIKRRIGFKRTPGTADGLTVRQAEARLRELMREITGTAPVCERLDVKEIGRRYVAQLERLGRKRSTTVAVKSALRVHLEPFFRERSLASITHNAVSYTHLTLPTN